ncbi:hypothetical protein AAKU64_004512 [Undibacterium sp. GrIS 1.8]
MFLNTYQIVNIGIVFSCKIAFFALKTVLKTSISLIKISIKIAKFLKAQPAKN